MWGSMVNFWRRKGSVNKKVWDTLLCGKNISSFPLDGTASGMDTFIFAWHLETMEHYWRYL